ncbi:MAG: YfiR family protein [Pirellulales bacterium]
MKPISLQTRRENARPRGRESASRDAACILRSRLLLLALVLAFSPAEPDESRVFAQGEATDVDREYTIKAAYLYNFGRYVEWPEQAFRENADAFVIGVLGTDPFGAVLDEIAASKKIAGRKIVTRRFNSMTQYVPCHILFVSASASPEEKAAAIRKSRESHVLLVGEAPGFALNGGIVNFFVEQNRVRFEINAEAAKREDLKVSSKLLSLAKLVGGN